MPASIGPPGREINFGAAEMCDDDPVSFMEQTEIHLVWIA